EKVAGDAHERNHAQVLIHRGDTSPDGVTRRSEDDLDPFKQHRSPAGPVHPGQNLDQRRLAGAVVAQQTVDLARVHRHGNVSERDDRAEKLVHAARFDERGHRLSIAFLRKKLLKMTAVRSIAPRNTMNQSVWTPVKKNPWRAMPKISAPKLAPSIEPYPPVSKLPPMTAVMMASNSFCSPRSTSAEPAPSTVSAATNVAADAVPMKSSVFTRATGTPALRAACTSPPTAKIQLPNEVRVSTQAAVTVRPTHQ